MRERALPLAIAVAALAAYLLLAVGNITTTSPTTDEGVHLAAGWSYYAHGDHRLNPEHPPLLKLLAAAPIASRDLEAMPDASLARNELRTAWSAATTNVLAQWEYQHFLFWGLRNEWFSASTTSVPPTDAWVNDGKALFRRARLTMLLTAIALAILVFCWSRELWGWWGAALSAALFCLDPNFIAHGGLVTTDVGVAMLMFGAVYFFWRTWTNFSWPNLVAFAAFFGLAQTAKFSAVLLAPIVVVLMLHRRDLRRSVIAIVALALATFIAIWAVYGFRSSDERPLKRVVEEWYATEALLPRYPEGVPDDALRRARFTTPIGTAGRVLLYAKQYKVLPESYLYGLALVRRSSIVRDSFLRGEYSSTGFRSYFLWTFLYKTPLPALALLLLALFTVRRAKMRALPFLLWPVLLYLGYSIFSNLNIGHRHVLPVVPFLYVLAGSLAVTWQRRRAVAAGVAFAALLVSSLVVFLPRPALMHGRHLSYMNELAGGPRNGYTKLLDSNFDWGQDLARLGEWLRANDVDEPIQLVYSSMAEPRAYGVAYRNMALGYWHEPQLPLANVRRGYLAIDASRLMGYGIVAQDRNAWRELLATRGREVGRAGYSIFIYRIE